MKIHFSYFESLLISRFCVDGNQRYALILFLFFILFGSLCFDKSGADLGNLIGWNQVTQFFLILFGSLFFLIFHGFSSGNWKVQFDSALIYLSCARSCRHFSKQTLFLPRRCSKLNLGLVLNVSKSTLLVDADSISAIGLLDTAVAELNQIRLPRRTLRGTFTFFCLLIYLVVNMSAACYGSYCVFDITIKLRFTNYLTFMI